MTSTSASATTALLDALFDEPGIGRCLVDPDGRVLRANAAWLRSTGFAPADVLGVEITSLFPESRQMAVEMHARARAGRRVRVPRHAQHVNGRKTWWEGTIAPVPMERGTGLLITTREITRELSKRAEEALRETLERFKTLADNIAQLAWMTDENGSAFWYNARWLEYTGATFEQMEGFGWQKVQHPDHLARVLEKFRGHIESGDPWEDTFPLRGKDGRYRWFLSRAVPIRDAEGKVVRWFGTNTDVTEQREMEERLRESDRRKSEFLGVLSHELRNPLAPIRNSIYLLDRAPPGSEQACRARDVLRRQTEHLARLVDDLLDITRISRGKVALQRARFDLRDVVHKTADDMRTVFADARVELRVDRAAGPVWFEGDATRISQVLGNLLHNAVKFTPAGGVVSVTALAAAGHAEVRVRDTGIGIEPGMLEHLFEPFAQGSQTLARTNGGLGLGLTLVKGLVELHGGTVEARSEGFGRGAEFVVRLPLADPATEARGETAPGGAPGSRVILVVEDNVDAGQTLADILALEGHRVSVAQDGASGIELARELRPDVVVCDVGLPDMDGYEVARSLRRNDALRTTRLVALSGYAQPEDRERAREAGFDAHIAKPPDVAALMRVLAGRDGQEAPGGQATRWRADGPWVRDPP